MLRLTLYVILALLVAAAVAWWMDNPGEVAIKWGGQTIYTSFAALVFMIAFLLGLGLLLQSFWHWLKRDMPLVGENRHLTKQRKGLTYLNQAIVALAAGDGTRARKLVEKAKKRLPPQPMMHVVAAQAAKLSGDKEAARLEFQGLLEDPAAAFLGARGLLIQAVSEGKTREARRLAEKAKDLNPKSAWAIKTLFDLQIKATDWDEARETLEAGKRAKAFSREDVKKLMATLYYCQAKETDLEGEKKEGRKLVGQALRSKKDFLPAVLMAARLDLDQGNKTRAARILEAAYQSNPHPDIARAYSRVAPMETDLSRLKRFQKLVKKNADHPESHMLLAIQNLALEKYSEAETHLDAVIKKTGRGQALTLKAMIAERQGAPKEDVEDLKNKALYGSPEPLWACSNCGAESEKWALHCPTCKMFNTLEWETEPKLNPGKTNQDISEFLVMLPDPAKEAGQTSRNNKAKK